MSTCHEHVKLEPCRSHCLCQYLLRLLTVESCKLSQLQHCNADGEPADNGQPPAVRDDIAQEGEDET